MWDVALQLQFLIDNLKKKRRKFKVKKKRHVRNEIPFHRKFEMIWGERRFKREADSLPFLPSTVPIFLQNKMYIDTCNYSNSHACMQYYQMGWELKYSNWSSCRKCKSIDKYQMPNMKILEFWCKDEIDLGADVSIWLNIIGSWKTCVVYDNRWWTNLIQWQIVLVDLELSFNREITRDTEREREGRERR